MQYKYKKDNMNVNMNWTQIVKCMAIVYNSNSDYDNHN